MHAAVKPAVCSAYPTGMICGKTADGRIIDLLEHRVLIEASDIRILFRPKTVTSHLEGEELLLPAPPRVTFFLSSVRVSRVFAWIMGMCARLRDNISATLGGLLHAIGFLLIWLEAARLGYSAAHTRRAILSFHPGIFKDDFHRGRDVFLQPGGGYQQLRSGLSSVGCDGMCLATCARLAPWFSACLCSGHIMLTRLLDLTHLFSGLAVGHVFAQLLPTAT